MCYLVVSLLNYITYTISGPAETGSGQSAHPGQMGHFSSGSFGSPGKTQKPSLQYSLI